MQCGCQCWADDSTETSHVLTTTQQNLRLVFATVIDIRVWRNARPDIVKYRGFPVALEEAFYPGYKRIEHSTVYVMEDIRAVEVIGFDMRKIPKDTRNRPRTDRFEPVLGNIFSLTVASSFSILVSPIFLLEDS